MSNICKFYNLHEMDTISILRKISEIVNREHRFYDLVGTKDSNDYILSIGLDVYSCIKHHCLKNHIFDNPPIYESGIICSPYMCDQLEFEVLTPDIISPWIVILRTKSEPFILYRKALEYAANDVEETIKTFYNKMYKLEQKYIESVIFNDPATIVLWNDRTKTVVKVADGETFDPEKGLAMAITKKYFGNHGNYYDIFKKWLTKDKTVYNKIPEYKRNRHIKNVIFNDPATIVFWNDGTKTVVKVQNEKFDPEKGLAMAITKKYFGNHGNYYNEFKKWLPVEKAKWKDPVEKFCSSCSKYFEFSPDVEPCHSCIIPQNRSNWKRADK